MMLVRKKYYINSTDEQLMQLLANGDAQAFQHIYSRYKSRLLYYFYRMLHNSRDKAQDFTQDLFYRLLEKPHLYDPSRNFSTWVFSIAHNMCKNEYRRLEIRKNTQMQDHLVILDEMDTRVERNDDLIEKIFSALEHENEEHRSCFLLKYREGFSIDEISEILKISKGTVKSRLHYTRKKLQAKFHHLYYEQ